MILAVVGSTNLFPGTQTEYAVGMITFAIVRCHPDKIVSGGAIGVDSLAEELAYEHKVEFEKFLPKNKRWKPEGYEDRNRLIAESCTHLLCIRTEQSTTYGSGWTADYAESIGKNVIRKII